MMMMVPTNMEYTHTQYDFILESSSAAAQLASQ
jgi:hypothetical protein